MVAPVQQGIYTSLSSPKVTWARSFRRWSQKKPYNLRLPFTMREVRTSAYGNFLDSYGNPVRPVDNEDARASQFVHPTLTAPYVASATNKCYANFVDQLKGDTAMLAVNLAERGQSVTMIANRAGQLLRFTKALKKLDMKGMEKALNIRLPTKVKRSRVFNGRIPKNKRLRYLAKDGANLFLECHFGWSPLVSDIQHAVHQVFKNPAAPTVMARASSPFSFRVGASPNTNTTYSGVVCVQMAADVTVTNPNLWLANRLGLVDAPGTLWELVPFSFLIDWFVNVGQVLASYSDFAGLSLTNSATSTLIRSTYHTSLWGQFLTVGGPPRKIHFGGTIGSGAQFDRTLGIASPKLQFRVPPRLSVARALTSISLLVQHAKF